MNSNSNHIQDWSKIAREAKWSVSMLATLSGVSVRTLERHFLTHLGKRPKKWLVEQRQRRVGELLRQGFSVKEVAGFLHYKHPSHLTNEFKKHLGHSPSKQGSPAHLENP
jgi:transcriptional regulator GlxA family with amidase domain